MTRRFWLALHRYAGLAAALFLIIAGLTGSLLAFYPELEQWLNPERHRVPVQNSPVLDGFSLSNKAAEAEPHAWINYIPLEIRPGKTVDFILKPKTNPETGQPYQLSHNVVYLNPYNGDIASFGGDNKLWPLNRKNILDFIYRVHYSLALGETGTTIFGIAALIWTLDCFIAFYLTFPKLHSNRAGLPPVAAAFSSPSTKQKCFWLRWAVAWRIKWPSSTLRLNFDLHRAGGLWTWLALLVFAWSSVMFNLQSVYKPVMSTLFKMPELNEIFRPDLPQPRDQPALDWQLAYQAGQSLMQGQARKHHFSIITEKDLSYLPEKGLFVFTVKSDKDIGTSAITEVFFDGDTGEFVNIFLPSGQYSGYTLTIWLQILHMAKIWGLPYKVFVCLLGLVLTMLSITGIYIWFKKHQAAAIKKSSHGNVGC